MKKILLTFLILLGIIVLARGPIVSFAVAQAVGKDIKIDGIFPRLDGIKLRGVSIKNGKTSLHIGHVDFQGNWFLFAGNPGQIESILFTDVRATTKTDGIEKAAVKAIEKLLPIKKKKKKKLKMEISPSGGREFIIGHIELKSIKLELKPQGLPTVKTKIDSLTFDDINSGKPLTLAQLVDWITKNVKP